MKYERVLVTGASGFLGRHVLDALRHAEVKGFLGTSRRRGCDLRDMSQVHALFGVWRPDAVIHLAGYNGGIAFNKERPGYIFYDNTVMGLNVLRACVDYEVDKVVSVVASCAYPYELPYASRDVLDMARNEVMEEADFLREAPHPSVACHGYAKRNLLLAARFFREEFDLNAITVCPTTLYGPGDCYDPARTKVVGGMVKRFCDAADRGDGVVTCWGTGEPLREFLYVEDCARLLVGALLDYSSGELLNLGTGQEMTVAKLASEVATAAGFAGRISWDETRPDGQYRKRLSLTRMRAAFPAFMPTPLWEGLRRTVADYRLRRGGA